MPRYLVLANQTLGSEELLALVQERAAAGPAEFWLAVPATPVNDLSAWTMAIPMPVVGGIPAIPAPPEEAHRLAQDRLDAALKLFSSVGATAAGEVCDPDPVRAAEAALGRQEFDEIIVSTLPPRLSRWLHRDLPDRLRKAFELPVTHVPARDV